MAEQAKGNEPGDSQQGGPRPTPEQRKDWQQKAEELNSADPAKKQAAEKAFDDAIGKDQREQLQQAQKQAEDGPPKTRQQAKQQAQRQIDRAAKQPGNRNAPGGAGIERAGDRLVANEKNRLKTAELQLADLEKIKNDPALQKRVGYTPEQYEAFLKSVRDAVARQREGVAQLEERGAQRHGERVDQRRRHAKSRGRQGDDGRRRGRPRRPARGVRRRAPALRPGSQQVEVAGDAMTPRYLVPVSPKKAVHRFADVLVIGGGIAGLRAALEIPPELSVLVVTKDRVAESNSSYAQGGIAGVLGGDDKFENHVEDTLAAGDGLCDRAVVEAVVREAPAEIEKLIGWGTRFDVESGALALTREGGHSHRRIVHALGDGTGHEVMRAVIARAFSRPNITLLDDTFTLDLLTDVGGQCVGATVRPTVGGPVCVWAKQTVLASGGCGMIYRETTNPPVATGDGMAAAYRAGAVLRDMEFMQFHPTVLYVAGSARFLVSEAVRGEGAYLRDCHGERFMVTSDPRAELAPRDIVARAIFRTMEQTRHPNVYLDLSHLPPELVASRFPGIGKVCAQYGLDIAKDRIPVRPGAHYMIGGVATDEGGPHDPAGAVGRGRGHRHRVARREPARVQLAGRRAGLRRALRARRGRGRRGDAGRVARPRDSRARAGREARRLFGRRRRDQLAAGADGPQDGHRPRPGEPDRGARRHPVLVQLRAGARVRQPRGLGVAEPAHGRAADDRVGAGARGVARHALPGRLPEARRRALAAARGGVGFGHRGGCTTLTWVIFGVAASGFVP